MPIKQYRQDVVGYHLTSSEMTDSKLYRASLHLSFRFSTFLIYHISFLGASSHGFALRFIEFCCVQEHITIEAYVVQFILPFQNIWIAQKHQQARTNSVKDTGCWCLVCTCMLFYGVIRANLLSKALSYLEPWGTINDGI